MKKTFILLMTILVPFVLGLAAQAKTKGAAAVASVSGKAETSADGNTWKALKEDAILEQGDMVRTSAGAKAKLMLEDGSIIVVGPLSLLTVTGLNSGSSGGGDFKLDEGKVRAITTKQKQADSAFNINTPTAVAGVRGTDFVVELDEQQTTSVTVFEGQVEVGSILKNIHEKMLVDPDHECKIFRDKAPEKPLKLMKDVLQKKKQEMARNRKQDAPDDNEAANENKARVTVVALIHNVPEKEKDKIVDLVRDGTISIEQICKFVASEDSGAKPDDVNKLINVLANKDIPAREKEKLVELIENGADPKDIGKHVKDIISKNPSAADKGVPENPGISREDLDKTEKEILAHMDKDKAKEALDKLDPNSPARKELAIIQVAIEKGLSKDKIEPLLQAIKNGMLNEKEALMLIPALRNGIDRDVLIQALNHVRDLKPDAEMRALIFKAISSGVDVKKLLEYMKAHTELTPQQIKERLQQLIKNKLNNTPDTKTQTPTSPAPPSGSTK